MTNPNYYYSGQHGLFFYEDDTSSNGSVKDWSFTSQMATLDATTLGDSYKVPVNGIRTITGSCTILWTTNANPDSANEVSSKIINKMIKIREGGETAPGEAKEAKNFTLYLKVDDNKTGNNQNKGRGIKLVVWATNISMRMAHGEIFAANISFESIGAPKEIDL